MDTNDAPKTPALPEVDPRSREATVRRQSLQIAERDAQGRLLPGAGRKPDYVSVTLLARAHTEAAINLLRHVVDNHKAPQAARVAAAKTLLDRDHGKAPIQIDMQVKARFDDFLRDVGVSARYEHEPTSHPTAPVSGPSKA